VGQLAVLARLDLSWCAALTRLPESLCQLTALKSLRLRACRALTELPFSLGFLPQIPTTDFYLLSNLIIPPPAVVDEGFSAIRAFLVAHNYPLKILFLILTARRRRMRCLPAELWVLLRDEFFK